MGAWFTDSIPAANPAPVPFRSFFCMSFFVAMTFFLSRAEHPPPDLSVLKGSASLRPGLIVSDFSGRPGPRAQQDFSKKSPPLKRPCGNRVYGSYFFGKSEPPGRFSVPETPPPGVRNVRRQVRMRRQRTEAGTTSTSSRAGSPRRRTTVLPAVSDAGVL